MGQNGEVLRLRNYRTYAKDGHSWMEYVCNEIDPLTGRRKREKKKDKHVFVAVLLGSEPMHLDEDLWPTEKYQPRIIEALRDLGFVTIEDAEKAGADIKKLGFERDPPKKKEPTAHMRQDGKSPGRVKCGMQRRFAKKVVRTWSKVTCKRCLAQRNK